MNEWPSNPNKKIDKFGTIRYFDNDNLLHREDGGPAVIWTTGALFWYNHGKLHRDDGPAIIISDTDQRWYKNGQLHRLDGPAIDSKYFIEGKEISNMDFFLMTGNV